VNNLNNQIDSFIISISSLFKWQSATFPEQEKSDILVLRRERIANNGL